MMVSNTVPPPDRSIKAWHVHYDPHYQRWQTYRTPLDWPLGLHQWLHSGMGPRFTGNDSNWDNHGGWIYFYREELVSLFLLKWS